MEELENAAGELKKVSYPEIIETNGFKHYGRNFRDFVDFPPELQAAMKPTIDELNAAAMGIYFEKLYNAAKKYISAYEKYKK